MAAGPGTQGLDDVRAQGREASGRAGRSRAAAASARAGGAARGARLLAEARWIILALLVAGLAAVLLSYRREDPGFTIATSSPHIHNWGGSAGAWLADLLYLLFGFSALLLVLLNQLKIEFMIVSAICSNVRTSFLFTLAITLIPIDVPKTAEAKADASFTLGISPAFWPF